MTRLTGVELRRLLARRLVLVAMAAGVLLTGLVLFAVWQDSQPISDTARVQAEQMYEQAREDWAEHGEEQIAECQEAEQLEAERTEQAVDYGCENMEPQREWFLQTAPPLQQQMPGWLGGMSYLLVFLAFLIGATFVAAEFSTGAISNWLTFQPRRLRVYASKVVAAGLGVVPLGAVLLALLAGGAWVITEAQGLADGMTSGHWRDAGWMGLRILALTVIAALIGSALAFLLRHTAAVLGLAIGYAIVVEMMFGNFLASVQPWLLGKNLEGWTNHGAVYYTQDCTTDATGTSCQMTEQAISFGHSATYLLVLAGLVVVAGAVTFRRRDVV